MEQQLTQDSQNLIDKIRNLKPSAEYDDKSHRELLVQCLMMESVVHAILKVHGQQKGHPVKHELSRLKGYFAKIDRKTINKEVAHRNVRHNIPKAARFSSPSNNASKQG